MTGLPRTVYSLPVILRKRDLLDRLRDLGKLLEFLLKVLYPDFQVGEGEGSFRALIEHAFQDPRQPFRSVTERDMVHARLMRNKATHGETEGHPPSETALANGERYLCAAINDLLPHLPPDLAAAVQGDPHSVDESLPLTEIEQLTDPVEKLRALAARLGALLTLQDQEEGNPPYPLGEGEFVPSVKQWLGRHYGKISQVSRAGLEAALDLAADPGFGSRTTVDEVKDATLRLTAAVQQLEAGLGLSGASKPSFDRVPTASAAVSSPTVGQPPPRSGNSWGVTLGCLGLLLLIGGGLALPSINAYRERVAKEAREVAQRRADEERARQLQRDSQRRDAEAKQRADEEQRALALEQAKAAAEVKDRISAARALRQRLARDPKYYRLLWPARLWPYVRWTPRWGRHAPVLSDNYVAMRVSPERILQAEKERGREAADELFQRDFLVNVRAAVQDRKIKVTSAEDFMADQELRLKELSDGQVRLLDVLLGLAELDAAAGKRGSGLFLTREEQNQLGLWSENPHRASARHAALSP